MGKVVLAAMLLLTAAAFAPAVTGQEHAHHAGAGSHQMGSKGMQALGKLSGRQFDVAFLSQMIEHHRGAVEMARDAVATAKRPEVKRAAQKIARDQRQEIQQMTTWLRRWYGVKPSQAHMSLMKADMAGMMAMKINDDRMFLDMMIPHHQGAIEMSQLALQRAGRSQVKSLARRIIREQKSEIASFKRMLGA